MYNMEKTDLDIDILGYELELKIINDCFKKTKSMLNETNYQNINKKIIKQLEYRLITSNIILIISTWEQQLMDFAYKFNNNIFMTYESVRKFFISELKIDENAFDEIAEYRNVTAVFKHGKNGDSFKKLIKKHSKFLENSVSFKELNETITFNLPVLNINEDDLEEVNKKLTNFWEYIYMMFKI